ncbi:MAG: hypothetical protein O7E57_01900 [Gammaproteobacteria bacterium]|nr:hypothetical protein [Gammaproteobacteria bacterium]
MSVFEYVVGIVSIVLGLALASLLGTIVETVKYRHTVNHYWVHTLWCAAMVFNIVGTWWYLWRSMSGIEIISVPQFSIALGLASLLYAISRLLSPDHTLSSALNLETYFYEIKTPFLICLFASPLIAMLSGAGAGGASPILPAMFLAGLLLTLIGIFTANRRAHAAIVVLWTVSYAVQETLQSPVGLP